VKMAFETDWSICNNPLVGKFCLARGVAYGTWAADGLVGRWTSGWADGREDKPKLWWAWLWLVMLKSYSICTAVKPHTELRNILVHPKYRIGD